jgi:hypothetical protein
MVMIRSQEKTAAVAAILRSVADADDDSVRDERIAMAWTIGANAQELHDVTGLPGAELKRILLDQGADPSQRRRGWRTR